MRKKVATEAAVETADLATKKKPVRRTTRKKATPAAVEEAPAAVEVEEVAETTPAEPQVNETAAVETPAEAPKAKETVASKAEPKFVGIRKIASNLVIHDFCDLANQTGRVPMLSDQQIQQLSFEDAIERCQALERILRQVLDYDIVLSDTNIWLELLVGHTSNHSDPRVNARLQFERQLEFISKTMKRIGGKFMIMSETYEEIDRFASVLDPVSYSDADWSDEVLCRNVAARLAKRLILAQQKENRMRIEGIGSESHHSAFADPAIIRRTVELFAQGRKVLLLTNDASVGIRSLGMCDDLQRVNNVDDRTWREQYEPQRPMVLNMDDLKLVDQYTRQYHFLMVAAGRQWMQDIDMREAATLEKPLELWLEGFRPGDRHERRSDRIEQQRKEQQRKEQQRLEQERKEQERKERQQKEQERREAQQQAAQERREAQQKAEQERREAQQKAEQERREAQQQAEQERRKADRDRNNARKKQEADQPAEEQAAEPVVVAEVDVQPQSQVDTPAEPVAEGADAPVDATEAPAAEQPKSNNRRRGGRRRSPKKES